MYAPVFWNTLLITNSAIERHNVPRCIFSFSSSCFVNQDLADRDLQHLASPRINTKGETFYLSNGLVSWINCDYTFRESPDLIWDDEVDLLEKCGLKYGRDMALVQWCEYELNTVDRNDATVNCEWIRTQTSCSILDDEFGLVWIDADKIFKGYEIKGIGL